MLGLCRSVRRSHRPTLAPSRTQTRPIQTSEERIKAQNEAIHKVRKLLEQWKDRLTVRNMRLCERYLNGELKILVYLTRELGSGDAANYHAIVRNDAGKRLFKTESPRLR